jgi:hypothetical protein
LSLAKYLVINLPYLVLAVFEWRLALVAFAVMLPNIVSTNGGSEKVGWSTHYHSMYFPYLIAAAGFGFRRVCMMYEKLWKRAALCFALILSSLFTMLLNPYIQPPVWGLDWGNLRYNAIFKAANILANKGDGEATLILAKYTRDVAAAIPEKAVVSTMEGNMPALLGKGRVLYYYPLGIGNADYVILNFTLEDNDKLKTFGAVSYLGADNTVALDACLNARIASEFTLERTVSPGSSINYGQAIFKRTKKE